MTVVRRLVPILLLAALCSGCLLKQARFVNARDAIKAANATFGEAYGRGDMDAVAALYTEDAMLLPPGGHPVQGRPAIAVFWKSVRGSGVTGAALTTTEIGVEGDLAYEVGTATLTIKPEGRDESKSTVKYVVVWKREQGTWWLHRDIWNDLPAD